MIKPIFYSFIVILLFTSATCRKAQKRTELEKALTGKWKYTGKRGGYAGKYEKANPAITHILQFKSRFRYLQKTGDQISEQGSYEIHKVKSIYSGKEDNAIRFSSSFNHPNKNSIISLRNDTLVITDNVYDGFKMEYINIK